jgi:small GTP-binding protein
MGKPIFFLEERRDGRAPLSKLPSKDIHEQITDEASFGLKVCMMGDGRVGKTSLVLRYTQNAFSPEYKQSLGASFAVKTIDLKGQQIKLVVWDIAGQPTFHQVRRHYYIGAHGALLVFDLTSPATFMTLENWIIEFRRVVPQGKIILVGNKVDLKDKRLVPREAAEMLQKWWEVPYIETSAATAAGVSEAFLMLATSAMEHVRTED